MAQADQSDYEHVLELDTALRSEQARTEELEEQWLAVSEKLGE
jgi:hypothetical protein